MHKDVVNHENRLSPEQLNRTVIEKIRGTETEEDLAIKKSIMVGSLKLLYHNGYKKLTLKNIAEQSNVDLYTLTDLYSSPIEIMTDSIQWAIGFGDTLYNDLESIKDPREKLLRYILMHFAFLSANPEMATLLLADESISGSRRIHNKLRQLRSHRMGLLKDVLTEGSKLSLWVSDDVNQLTLMILGYMRMTIASWKQSQEKQSLYVHGKIATQFIQDILFSSKTMKESEDE